MTQQQQQLMPASTLACVMFGGVFLLTFALSGLGLLVVGVWALAAGRRTGDMAFGAIMLVIGVPLLAYSAFAGVQAVRGHRGGVVMGFIPVILGGIGVPTWMLVQTGKRGDSNLLFPSLACGALLVLFLLAIIALTGSPPATSTDPDDQEAKSRP